MNLERMITVERADRVARALTGERERPTVDCRAEIGREGLPCRICAEHNERWRAYVDKVRAAMMEAFR